MAFVEKYNKLVAKIKTDRIFKRISFIVIILFSYFVLSFVMKIYNLFKYGFGAKDGQQDIFNYLFMVLPPLFFFILLKYEKVEIILSTLLFVCFYSLMALLFGQAQLYDSDGISLLLPFLSFIFKIIISFELTLVTTKYILLYKVNHDKKTN